VSSATPTERTVWVVRYSDDSITSYLRTASGHREEARFTEYPDRAHEHADRHDAYLARDLQREVLLIQRELGEDVEPAALRVLRRYRPATT
jgi:hypothetical protein